jgi:hypothetical protein
MPIQFNVYVVDEDGNPVVGKRVTVHWSIWRGHLEEFTDDSGHAWFDSPGEAGTGTIYVNGENQGEHWIEDGDGFTVEI